MPTEAVTSVYGGLDLHKHNVFCGLIDQEGRPIYRRRLRAELPTILQALEPYRPRLQAIAVESTFNWYWLVDGLQAADYPVRLANPAAMSQYSGLKQTNDETDALWLAELLRLGILPEGYIYPKAERPVRDMLRRRMLIVRQATQTVLSLQSMVTRHTGQSVSATKLQDWTWSEVRSTFADAYSQQTASALLELLSEQRRRQHHLEKQVLAAAKPTPTFQRLVRLPGIGPILGMTIALETGPLARFASAGDYASYCRTVNSRCQSAGKKKGEHNRKNGNPYLAWAYVEAAHFAQRYSPRAQAWFARKMARDPPRGGGEGLGVQTGQSRLLRAARRRGLRRGQAVWSSGGRRPQARAESGSEPIRLIGSGRRPTFTVHEERLFCLHREPRRVGRTASVGTSHGSVSDTQWTRCGTEGFLGPHSGQGPREIGRESEAWSRTRWVTEQNSKTKQPRRGQPTRVEVRGSTEEEARRAGKASGRNFCLDRNL